ncbi:14131_t:CDS:1, partial [Racocetra fulgida]
VGAESSGMGKIFPGQRRLRNFGQLIAVVIIYFFLALQKPVNQVN